MIEVTRGTRGELVFRLTSGTFDVRQVRERIDAIPAGADVVLDLTQVRQVQDHGLLALASALAERTPSVAVRGLGRHQERLLRYLGVELSRIARSGDAQAQ